MATYEDIFGYELAIETAWKSILDTAFLGALQDPVTFEEVPVCVVVQASDSNLFSPIVEVQLRHVQATGQTHQVDVNTTQYSAWKGLLVSRVVTIGGVNSKFHATMIAKIRAEAARDNFNISNLPFHSVREMMDHDSPRGVTHGSQITGPPTDFTEVTYLIQFNVIPDAW